MALEGDRPEWTSMKWTGINICDWFCIPNHTRLDLKTIMMLGTSLSLLLLEKRESGMKMEVSRI